jgi:hypothetical protein
MNFDFDSQTRRQLGYQLIDTVDHFFGSLPERPVQPPAENRSYRPRIDPIPQTGEDPVQVLT